jgi:hypothetical protein
VCAWPVPSQLARLWTTNALPNFRSVSDNHVFVICRDGTFYELVPEDVRHQGPWQGMHRGEIEKLKHEYRLALAQDGYALVKCELAVFKPEV